MKLEDIIYYKEDSAYVDEEDFETYARENNMDDADVLSDIEGYLSEYDLIEEEADGRLIFHKRKTRKDWENEIVDYLKSISIDEIGELAEISEIAEIYKEMCEKYPENEDDPKFLEQVIRDFLSQKSDDEVYYIYSAI